MNRSRFIEKYKITDISPVSVSDNAVSVIDFVNETDKFLSNNFEGLFKIVSNPFLREHIQISLDYIIYFFKLLALDIHGENTINVNCSCQNDDFVIEINADSKLHITDEETRELIRAARNSGFSIKKTDEGFILTKALLTAKTLSVFTRIIITGSGIAKRFSKIFFGK